VSIGRKQKVFVYRTTGSLAAIAIQVAAVLRECAIEIEPIA